MCLEWKNGKFDISGAKRFIPTNTLKPWLFSLPKEAPARPRHQRWRAKLQKKTEGWRITQHRHMLYAAYALYRYYIYIHLYTIHSTWVYGWMGLYGHIYHWILNIKSYQIVEKPWQSCEFGPRLASGSEAAHRCASAQLSVARLKGLKQGNATKQFVDSSILISLSLAYDSYIYMYIWDYIYMKETFSLSKVLTCFFHILLSFSCWESSAPFLPHKLISPP